MGKTLRIMRSTKLRSHNHDGPKCHRSMIFSSSAGIPGVMKSAGLSLNEQYFHLNGSVNS